MSGAQVTGHTGTAIIGFVRVRRTPNVLVAILLFLLCIVPLVIYLIVQSKDDTFPFTIELVPVDGGTEVRWSGVGDGANVAQGAVGSLPSA